MLNASYDVQFLTVKSIIYNVIPELRNLNNTKTRDYNIFNTYYIKTYKSLYSTY